MTSYEGEVLLRYLERKHQEIVKECIAVIRDGEWHAVKRALTRYVGVEPPSKDLAECRAELLRLVRGSTPTRDEISRARLNAH